MATARGIKASLTRLQHKYQCVIEHLQSYENGNGGTYTCAVCHGGHRVVCDIKFRSGRGFTYECAVYVEGHQKIGSNNKVRFDCKRLDSMVDTVVNLVMEAINQPLEVIKEKSYSSGNCKTWVLRKKGTNERKIYKVSDGLLACVQKGLVKIEGMDVLEVKKVVRIV